MSDVIKEYFESTFETSERLAEAPNRNEVLSTVGNEGIQVSQSQQSETSNYTLACDNSQMSRDVDLWLREPTGSTGIQPSRHGNNLIQVNQRSASAHISSNFNCNGMCYVLALLLPFFSISNYPQWRCSPSTMINTAELFITQVGRACDRVRCNIRRLAQNQSSRELLATAMDILLVVYAIGFLILSMYQASIIG